MIGDRFIPAGKGIVAVSGEAALPTKYGKFMCRAFRDIRGREHIALYKGVVCGDGIPVRIHSSCATGDIFHSLRCDCGKQLSKSLSCIEKLGCGILIYMAQEGRGIGLFNKINAYVLQDNGLDTVEANEELGFESDARDYGEAAEILRYFGVKSARLITNNPAKIKDLESKDIGVLERISLKVRPNSQNRRYIMTKKDRMGHLL
jgi:3,4-dihydroxy 2-butanone 4-phosphate synthase / GTP cyclohydrolase II